MRKLPTGISNFEELVRDNCIYVDKTMYIEKLENLSDKRIMFLRPRKFGKTLFTSVLENYYDILRKDKFENLFKNTYIGKNPTANKNQYHILRFNFSGIDTSTEETTIKGFKSEVSSSIKLFVEKYKLDFYINKDDFAENILDNLFKAFFIQKNNEKIYVIIDEYDHFANELLGFHTEEFKNIVSKNGKVRKWYEILKKGTESVVERIFITGVAPITLDSTTSGFNIARDITKNIEFNDMLGFNNEDVKYLMKELEIEVESIDTESINYEILEQGKIDKIIKVLGEYLESLSNRDYQRFDEKYVKLIFYTLSRMLGTMTVKSELEVGGKYADILLIPREKIEERYGILIEFKYIKQEDFNKNKELLNEKEKEAQEQLTKYKNKDEIRQIPKLKAYSVVAIKDKLIVKEN